MQFVRSQHTIEELLRFFVSMIANRAAQAPPVGRCGTLHHPLQDLILGFRKLIDVVEEVDKQKLLRERLRKAQLHAKRELAVVAKLKLAMALEEYSRGHCASAPRADRLSRSCP
ncbi:hypothetical protein JJB98_29710 [Bradyrhizobium diazoefficiens]|nr:hypothetical protein [Bradyrhizobium diazoefficiens]QQO23767.1 hypothetical protein JJB98_29710 [Bradyrhizobium diazoefficiens]